jgi:NAD-dependent SIR2 family protein deacetylase
MFFSYRAGEEGTPNADIPKEDLPSCKKCKGLVRPHIVWFDEDPTEEHMELTCKIYYLFLVDP